MHRSPIACGRLFALIVVIGCGQRSGADADTTSATDIQVADGNPSDDAMADAADAADAAVDTATDAVREGRRAMRAKEAELSARRDGRAASLAEVLGPDDEVQVDGVPVDAAQVVVLRDPNRVPISRRRRGAR